MSIKEIYLTDVEEEHAPPSSEMLCLEVVGRRLFVTTMRCKEETMKHTEYEHVAQVAVDVYDLVAAVTFLVEAQVRESKREKV